jgi:glycosyltransferase involved in cell wall biosynthesis
MAPAISVIIPCHNGGRFLDGLLASLAEQSFRDFEVVIVNNGSTEPATLDKLAALESIVRVVHQENKYLPGARNTGFHEARADFVLPIDCDDRLESLFLEQTVAVLRAAPDDVGFVFTHMRLVGMFDGVFASHFNQFDQLFINRLPYCMLFRKTAWAAVGGYDETMRDGCEDWEFGIRLARANYCGVEVPQPFFIYMIRPDGMLQSRSARMLGTIWRQVRERNPELFRLSALFRTWRAAHCGLPSAMRAIALLAMFKLLPESWYNAVIFRLYTMVRARRAVRGDIRAVPIGT